MMADYSSIARLQKCSRVFGSGENAITALQETDLEIFESELLLILGPSGSGKTTLLSLLGCVLYPTSGIVCIDSICTKELNQKQLADVRLHKIGFVFQNYNLIAPLTALENVMFPLRLLKLSRAACRERAESIIDALGMSKRKNSLPRQLSGGEQQRIAIARALVTQPAIVLCDEPTASLDVRSAEVVMKELRNLTKQKHAVIVVTHDNRLISYADKIKHIEDGFVTDGGAHS
jgi:putative ABC transport system ATP-binding protein